MASYIVLMMYIYSFLYCLVDMMSPNSVSVIMELRCCLLYFFLLAMLGVGQFWGLY